jgi:hypothetical protein
LEVARSEESVELNTKKTAWKKNEENCEESDESEHGVLRNDYVKVEEKIEYFKRKTKTKTKMQKRGNEDYGSLNFDAVLSGRWAPIFWRNRLDNLKTDADEDVHGVENKEKTR